MKEKERENPTGVQKKKGERVPLFMFEMEKRFHFVTETTATTILTKKKKKLLVG